jgi:muramoyltetrapeptide carboxypeptidase
MGRVRVGIVAPSSAVGQVELGNGVARLREGGFDVVVHPKCARLHYTFAGADRERAEALFGYARDPNVDVVWAAGGGYGATRLLPLLDAMTQTRGKPPRKLLLGYSDVTVLHEYVRSRWGWSTLHFPMPSAASFCRIEPRQFQAAVALVNGRRPDEEIWGAAKFLANPPTQPIRGMIVGGNLSLWAALAGTPYEPATPRGRFVFLEDIDEAPYRIDRMTTQLVQSGAFDGAAAIVLGDFTNCEDNNVAQVLAADGSGQKVPLRPRISLEQAMEETFARLGRERGITVAAGLPVGHGPNYAPLPLGAEYELGVDGRLKLVEWDWLR